MDSKLHIALESITKAGDYLTEQFHKRHDVSLKEDNTVLLREDKRSEEIILRSLTTAFPSDSFLTEETPTDITSDMVWVIDPLCGSYSYLRGVETWSISLALVSNNEYLIGAVYQPLLHNLFYSQKGKGAFLNKHLIHVARTTSLSEAFISVEHGVFTSEKYNTSELIRHIKRIRVAHGSGGELAYVGAGYLDAVIKTNQAAMHFAGGRAVAEEAGAAFIDFTGERAPIYLDRNKTIDYITTTPALKEQLLQYVNKYE